MKTPFFPLNIDQNRQGFQEEKCNKLFIAGLYCLTAVDVKINGARRSFSSRLLRVSPVAFRIQASLGRCLLRLAWRKAPDWGPGIAPKREPPGILIYFFITSSFIPAVDTKYLIDQIPSSIDLIQIWEPLPHNGAGFGFNHSNLTHRELWWCRQKNVRMINVSVQLDYPYIWILSPDSSDHLFEILAKTGSKNLPAVFGRDYQVRQSKDRGILDQRRPIAPAVS
jgi:hypothetical protein